jgi:MFS family permease
LGYGLFIIVALRFVDARAPRSMIGTYQSLYGLAFFTIPSLVFMPILGVIYDNFSLQTLFVVDGIVGIAAVLLLVWLQRLVRKAENPTA